MALGKSARKARRATAVAIAALIGVSIVAAERAQAAPDSTRQHQHTCQLGNGVQHVISLVFDNVHFARDNPNVPSDLEQMPHLLNFLEQNGTVLSNLHTPMIAHTADDSLSIYTGLYGDRHGQPLSNSYKTYNPSGTTDPATSFAYWTSPVVDTASSPTAGHDTLPTMAYSATTPATPNTGQQTPAPWVPFTRAGCSVGDFSTANMVLENTSQDINTVFGADSPESAQLAADPDSFKDPEVADYIGVAVHCAQRRRHLRECPSGEVRANRSLPDRQPDLLPTEPGGYIGYQGLFGARYVAPVLGAGTPNLTHNGYPVTDANGVLTDLSGVPITNQFSHTPGFPGFSPTASQTLAYLADMQEGGIPITYGYISDIHERKAGTSNCTTTSATGSGKPIGPGDSCYVTNAKAYDAAFAAFFDRLQKDGITPANTEFVISAEENDQLAGANVGRASEPTPAGCDGVTVACHYANGQIGELQANVKGLLSTTASVNTAFDVEPQGASIYVHGNPASDDPAVRQLERDTASMTGNNPYSGVTNEKIVKYQAGRVEQRILHMQTGDPLRTPTYTMFPVPDYFFSTTGPNVSINSSFAWDHGYYSPNIDVTWGAFAGPGVARLGVDGPQPADGNEASDPNSTRTVPQASGTGTYADEVDLRPTLLHLVGLQDDYPSDGTIVNQVLTDPTATPASLAVLYRQLNSSVGEFATDTLIAESAALASGSAGNDEHYADIESTLQHLADARDALVSDMKPVLASGAEPSHGQLTSLTARGTALLRQAANLTAHA